MRRRARKARRPSGQGGKRVIGHNRADSRTGYVCACFRWRIAWHVLSQCPIGAKSTEIKQITANVILLDLELEQYGPDAQNLRIVLRKAIPPLIDQIWSEGDRAKFSPFMATAEATEFVNKLRQLQPNTDSQRALQAELLSAIANLSKARLSLFTQSNDAIPTPFLVILILWLAVIFASFGLFVRPNRIAIVTFFIGGLSVASAIFLILEMGQPFTGLMQISGEGLRHALGPLGP
jgi:Protein of unknown function (DUF4239)